MRPSSTFERLTALGYAVPVLGGGQLREIGPGSVRPSVIRQSLVVGIGTGFNVSPVLETAGSVLCPAAEAGHISMPRSVAQRLVALGIPETRFPTVEALFSGRGLSALCTELTQHDGLSGPEAIAAYGRAGADAATKAIDQYSGLLGHLLRDLSLSYMPSSGIYLAGSVARAIARTAPTRCVDVLRSPCKISNAANVPVWMIEDDGAALLGCAGYSNSW